MIMVINLNVNARTRTILRAKALNAAFPLARNFSKLVPRVGGARLRGRGDPIGAPNVDDEGGAIRAKVLSLVPHGVAEEHCVTWVDDRAASERIKRLVVDLTLTEAIGEVAVHELHVAVRALLLRQQMRGGCGG